MNKSHQIVVETPKVITKKSKNGKTKVGEVEVCIMGKSYKVPAGLTIIKAVEFAGYRFIRGCGCRAGFCGACSTVYRIEDEQNGAGRSDRDRGHRQRRFGERVFTRALPLALVARAAEAAPAVHSGHAPLGDDHRIHRHPAVRLCRTGRRAGTNAGKCQAYE